MDYIDQDEEVIEVIRGKKRTRPRLASLLSKDKVDDFELDVMMNEWG